ncbi:hypothetical protein FRB97_002944 [Tulasnella sp. 331]|nr:hypothetical protein FRB97_002944 [Tulasnella sp. 331]
MLAAVLGTIFLLFLLSQLYRHMVLRGALPHPPGPPGEFIIGNLRQMPLSHAWLTFAEWGRKYGPLNYISILGRPILIINTQEVALDLLEKRAAIYSDRPRFVMLSELSDMGHAAAFMGYGNMHKKHRKLLAQSLHPRIVERDYVSIQEGFTFHLAKALLDDPNDFITHLERCVHGTLQTIAYGEHNGEVDFVDLGRENMRNVVKIAQGYMVEFLPWLKYVPEWFPGAHFQRDARHAKEVAERTRWLPYNVVEEKLANGTATPSFVVTALKAMESAKAGDINRDIVSSTAFSLFGAGSETTAGTVLTFVLVMLLYPDVQARAQAEIDRVFGEQLPSITNKASTPYLNAVLKETFRWQPVVPLGLPHRLMQDDVYNGYLIRKGTTVLVNAWGILHDERHFPDPFTFNPDRFLLKDEVDKSLVSKEERETSIDPWDVAFGYGRRICPGIAVAQSAEWIMMATILACFDIRQKINPQTMQPMVTEPIWSGDTTSALTKMDSIWTILKLLEDTPEKSQVIHRTQQSQALTDRLDERPEGLSILPLVKLQLEDHSRPIFENLTFLQLNVTDALADVLAENIWLVGAWGAIIPPSLIGLDLSLAEWMSAETLIPFFQLLTNKLPELVDFKLEGPTMGSDTVTAAIPFFKSLSALTHLALPDGSEGLLLILAQQPKLSALTVSIDSTPPQLANLGPHPLSYLKCLKVTIDDSGHGLNKTSTLLNYLPVGQLEDVAVEHTSSVSTSAQKGFPGFARGLVLHTTSLTSLSIQSYADVIAPSLSDPKHLIRLKELVNLQELVISTPGWQLDIDIHQLDEMTKGMGQLRVLNLNGCNGPEDYANPDDIVLSDDSFYVLARNCPLLKTLMIRVDFVSLDQDHQEALKLRFVEAMEYQARFEHMDFLNVFGSNIVSEMDSRGRDSRVLNKAAFVIAVVMPPGVKISQGFGLDEEDEEAPGKDANELFRLLPKAVRGKRRQFETAGVRFPLVARRFSAGFALRGL